MADTEYTGFMYAAHRDVLIVENLAKEIDPYTEAIAFHSRQAAEKMVKNVFIQNGIVPSKTHSVDELLSKAIDSGWLSVEPPGYRCRHQYQHACGCSTLFPDAGHRSRRGPSGHR